MKMRNLQAENNLKLAKEGKFEELQDLMFKEGLEDLDKVAHFIKQSRQAYLSGELLDMMAYVESKVQGLISDKEKQYSSEKEEELKALEMKEKELVESKASKEQLHEVIGKILSLDSKYRKLAKDLVYNNPENRVILDLKKRVESEHNAALYSLGIKPCLFKGKVRSNYKSIIEYKFDMEG